MAKNRSTTSKEQKIRTAKTYGSFLEWKEMFFPDLVKEDRLQQLRKDSGLLAQVLANDTFDRVHKRAS